MDKYGNVARDARMVLYARPKLTRERESDQL